MVRKCFPHKVFGTKLHQMNVDRSITNIHSVSNELTSWGRKLLSKTCLFICQEIFLTGMLCHWEGNRENKLLWMDFQMSPWNLAKVLLVWLSAWETWANQVHLQNTRLNGLFWKLPNKVGWARSGRYCIKKITVDLHFCLNCLLSSSCSNQKWQSILISVWWLHLQVLF